MGGLLFLVATGALGLALAFVIQQQQKNPAHHVEKFDNYTCGGYSVGFNFFGGGSSGTPRKVVVTKGGVEVYNNTFDGKSDVAGFYTDSGSLPANVTYVAKMYSGSGLTTLDDTDTIEVNKSYACTATATKTATPTATQPNFGIVEITANCEGSGVVTWTGANPGDIVLTLYDKHLGNAGPFIPSDPLIQYFVPADATSPHAYQLDLSGWTGGPHYRVDSNYNTKSASYNCPGFEPSATPTVTPTASPTDTATNTPVPPSATPTDTATNTPAPPSATPTDTETNTPVPPSETPTLTATATETEPGPSETPTETEISPSDTPSPTVTATNEPSATPTITQTQPGPSETPTETEVPPTATGTASPTVTTGPGTPTATNAPPTVTQPGPTETATTPPGGPWTGTIGVAAFCDSNANGLLDWDDLPIEHAFVKVGLTGTNVIAIWIGETNPEGLSGLYSGQITSVTPLEASAPGNLAFLSYWELPNDKNVQPFQPKWPRITNPNGDLVRVAALFGCFAGPQPSQTAQGATPPPPSGGLDNPNGLFVGGGLIVLVLIGAAALLLRRRSDPIAVNSDEEDFSA